MSKQNEKVVIMTEKELESLVYYACVSANNKLYDGLQKRFLHDYEKMLKTILFELEEMNR